jgi:hypothetical protein
VGAANFGQVHNLVSPIPTQRAARCLSKN